MSQEEAMRLKDSILEALRPELEKVVDGHQGKKKIEVAPMLSQKGLQHQANLNVDLLNLLEPLSRIEGAASIHQAATEMLKRRNMELIFADQSPDGFRVLEKVNAFSALSGGAGSSSDATQMILMSQLMQQESRPRKRQASPMLFRKPGPYGMRTDGPRNSEVDQLRKELDEIRRTRTMDSGRSSPRCYSCHQTGHYANACPQRGRTFPR